MMKRVVAALIVNDGQILACQRTRHQVMPLKWEFPGGKIEEGEQPRDALRRELEEELGIEATIGDEVARIHHEYPGGGVGGTPLLRSPRVTRARLRIASSAKFAGSSEMNYWNSTSWKPTAHW